MIIGESRCSIRSPPTPCPSTSTPDLSLVKLGEEAWVDLTKFTLEGAEGRKLRQTFARAQRSGAGVEIVHVKDCVQ